MNMNMGVSCYDLSKEPLISKWVTRIKTGINKLTLRKSITAKQYHNKDDYSRTSFDSGLGSDLLFNSEEYPQSTYSAPSSPPSILRSTGTSPLSKKKISFSMPEHTQNLRKRSKVV